MTKIFLFFFVLSGFFVQSQTDGQLIMKSKFLLSNNRLEEAHQLIDSIQSENYYSDFIEAEIYFRKKEFSKAIASYLLSNQKLNYYSDFQLSKSYAQIEQFDSAAYYLKRYLLSKHKLASNIVKTDTDFERFKKSKNWNGLNIDSYYSQNEKSIERAIYYKNRKELDLALDILDELILNNKDFLDAYYYRAKFIVLLNEDYKYAIKDVKRIINIEPTNYKYNKLLADLFFHETKYKKALGYYLKAEQLFPYSLSDLLKISKSYYRMGEYGKAILYASKYVDIAPKDIEALKILGQIYYDEGEMQASIDVLNKAVFIDSRRIDILVARGKAFLEHDEYQRAGRDFNIALDLDSDNGELWYLKGLAFLYQDKRDEACRYFTKASYLNYYKADEYLLKECQK